VPEAAISPVAKALTLVRAARAAGFGPTSVIVLEAESEAKAVAAQTRCRILGLSQQLVEQPRSQRL